MPQPSVFRALRPSDKQFTPFQTYKNYTVGQTTNDSGTTSIADGYEVLHAIHAKRPPSISASSAANDPTNTNGINQHVAWNAIDHRYYRHPYDPAKTAELTDRRKTDKFLFYSASLLSVPYFEMGERVKANSVSIEHSDFTLQDDGNGNLRDALINSASFANRKKLIAYWSFNNEFRNFQNQVGTLNSSMPFDSRTFTPEFSSVVKNVKIENGVATSATSASGLAGKFDIYGGAPGTGFNLEQPVPKSYVVTDHHDDFNLGTTKDWTIGFWLNAPGKTETAGHYATLISKRYEKYVDVYNTSTGLINHELRTTIPSGSVELTLNETDRSISKKFPFHIEIDAHRRDLADENDIYASIGGENFTATAKISASLDGNVSGSWNHIAVRHSSNMLEIYLNGVATAQSASTAGIGNSSNKSRVLFGRPDTLNNNVIDSTAEQAVGQLSGSMAEIRFYDYACTDAEVVSLANAHYISGSLYQTNVAGNVFYRNGHMVVSSPMPKYHDTLQGAFTANYKGTHTVYENTVLCNIPKDTMNVSVNPSAIKQGYDSLRIDGMTTGSLLPYVTEIGLYNDNCELLAIGKLGQAIQKRNDVDLNFIVRWDY